jgi:putative FmdB family regulatory protein
LKFYKRIINNLEGFFKMPRYDYKCSVCSGQIEFEKAINEDKYPVCCNQSMQRLWSAPAAIFNGSGFYSTDNRK